MNTTFIEMFDSSDDDLKVLPESSVDLDQIVFGIDDRQHSDASNQFAKQVCRADLIRDVVGEAPAVEPKVQKVYRTDLVKDVFGGAVAAPAPLPTEVGAIPSTRQKASQREVDLRQLIEAAGIQITDSNRKQIADLIASMTTYVDGQIKSAKVRVE